MKIVDDLIKCKYCCEVFDTPIFLTCCSETICKKHIPNAQYKCYFCNHEHKSFNFPINKTVQKLIETEFDKLDFGSEYNQSKNVCDEFKKELEKCKRILKNPLDHIEEHVSNAKAKLCYAKEHFKEKMERLYQKMVNELNNFETECSKNVDIPNILYEHYYKLKLMEMEFDYEKSSKDYDLLRMDKAKWNENLTKASVQINQIQNIHKSLLKDLFMNKTCTFENKLDFKAIEDLFCSGLNIKTNVEKKIKLEIEKFSKFCFSDTDSIHSEYIVQKMLKFNISTEITKCKEDNELYMGFFLNCDGNEKNYPVSVKSYFKLVNQKNAKFNKIQYLEYTFEKNSGYGFPKYIKIKSLMNEESGFYDRVNDKITFELEII